MPKLTVTFRAANANDVAEPLPLPVVAVVDYERSAGDEENPASETTRREVQLSNTATGTLTAEDDAGAGAVMASVRSAGGEVLLEPRAVVVNVQGDGRAGEVALTAADIAAIRGSIEDAPAPAAYAVRSGQFVVINDGDMGFSRRRMLVGLCAEATHEVLRAALASPIPIPLPPNNPGLLAALSEVQLHWVKLGLDGGFEFQLPADGAETGWVWLLTGAVPWIGLQDDLVIDPRAEVVIAITPGQGAGAAGNGKLVLPQDVSEAEVLRNADLFGDDPGTSCQPFQNRHRILSERTIHSILRVEQPEIGGEPSVTIAPPLLIDPPRLALLPSVRALAPQPGLLARLGRAARALANQPVEGLPVRAAEVNARLNERVRWVRQRSRGRQTMDAAHPAEWEGDASIYQATSVARGHILEFRVRWRSNGYSLGNVSHSLTLAPRQVKRITMVDWSRREATARTERTVQRDELEQVTTRDRDYTDAVASQLSEWSKGGSKSSSTGAAAGIGFVAGPVVVGGGAAHGRSSASSWQQGGRSATAQEEQSLRDAVRQYGDSLRQMESTVVQETSQEETAIGVSEMVRNPNYCHALTIVYHEILRHLRIDTELVGVRECVFVPFAIRPFTVERALRWRDEIRARLLERDLGWVLRHLEDVVDDFATSSVPPGPRAAHRVTYLSGSMFIQLNIERPRNDAEDGFVEQNWLPLVRFLGMSALTAFARLKERVEAERERTFQQEMAPQIASQWVNTLSMEASGTPLTGIDFTLATKYRPNGVVRVDFALAPGTPLTRNRLQQLRVLANQALPPGSVANVQRITLTYHTATFQHEAASGNELNDLVDPATGARENSGAVKFLPTDAFERQDLRAVIRAGAERVVNHLNEHVEYYHKAIWWHMDRDKLYMLLDGFLVPGGDGRSIASVVERSPMAIVGNALVYRVAAGVFLGTDAHKSPKDLLDYYRPSGEVSEPIRVSLPTSGLYAQALKDPCEACEEHYGNTDWVLSDREPELEALGAEALRSRRAEPPSVTPTTMGPTLINLPAVPEAPAPSGFADLLRAVTTANAFRDMAGLAQTQANAAAALQQAAGLASDFGSKAVEVRRAEGATQQAPQKLAAIERAKDGNLIDETEATAQAKQVLGDMHTRGPDPQSLTVEDPVKNLIDRAGDSGTPIAVRRGMESVEVGGPIGTGGGAGQSPEDAAVAVDLLGPNPPGTRAFAPAMNDKSGRTSLTARVTGAPAGGSVRWSSKDAGALTFSAPTSPTTDILGALPGLRDARFEVVNSAGAVIRSGSARLSVPQFVVITEQAAEFDVALVALQLDDVKAALIARVDEVMRGILAGANVRIIWQVAGVPNDPIPAFLDPPQVPRANYVTLTLRNADPSGKGRLGTTLDEVGVATFANVGPNNPRENILCFVGQFPIGGGEVAASVSGAVAHLLALNMNDPVIKQAWIEIAARMLAENFCHEIGHALLGQTVDPSWHNNPAMVSDIMNHGSVRQFVDRSAIEVVNLANFPLDPASYRDGGLAAMSRFTPANLAKLNAVAPVPPAFP